MNLRAFLERALALYERDVAARELHARAAAKRAGLLKEAPKPKRKTKAELDRGNRDRLKKWGLVS